LRDSSNVVSISGRYLPVSGSHDDCMGPMSKVRISRINHMRLSDSVDLPAATSAGGYVRARAESRAAYLPLPPALNGDRPADVRAGRRTASVRAVRLLNLVAAWTLLILTLPVMLAVALLVKLTSPGPMLYSQLRVGLDRRVPGDHRFADRRRVDYGGRLFRIYKFRTMYHSPGDVAEAWAAPNDPRVTPLGRVLRQFRLDELPQLINVIRGEMSIVGPRPEQPAIFQRLRRTLGDYPRRQRVPPGITGLAQISQHYDRSLDDVRRKLEYDLQYIARRSLREDLRIMARTFPVVFLRLGAW
jgi:lipopolysaccharide/colanic/teichoic acid biosynthesis glycosyltransferase